MSIVNNYDYFLFDLDDTLYPEVEYLKGAYDNIAKFLSKKKKLKHELLYQFLIHRFNEEGRDLLFDSLFEKFNIEFNYMTEILQIMRTYTPENKISLYPKTHNKLSYILNQAKKVFVITNGNVVQQKNKVKNIDWNSLEQKIIFIYANEYKKKPSVQSFNSIKMKYNIQESLTIMIGDSFFDKKYAENCGIDFMHIEKFNLIIN